MAGCLSYNPDDGIPMEWHTGVIPSSPVMVNSELYRVTSSTLVADANIAKDVFYLSMKDIVTALSGIYTPTELFGLVDQFVDDAVQTASGLIGVDGNSFSRPELEDFTGYVCPVPDVPLPPRVVVQSRLWGDYDTRTLYFCNQEPHSLVEPDGGTPGWNGEVPEFLPFPIPNPTGSFMLDCYHFRLISSTDAEGEITESVVQWTREETYLRPAITITEEDIRQQYYRAFREEFGNNPEDPWYFEHSGVHDPYWDNVWSLVHFEEYSDEENSVLLCEKGKTLVATNETGEHLSEDYGVFGKGWTSLLVEGGQYAQLEYEETIPYEDFAVSTIEFRYRKTEENSSHYAMAYGGGMIQVNSPTNNILGFSSPGGSVNALSPINIGQYYDICVVFDTDVAYFFIDGQLQGTTGTNFFFGPEYTLAFGVETFPLGGCNIDEVRITLGVARYTDDYEVADGPFSHGQEEEEEEEVPNTPKGRFICSSSTRTLISYDTNGNVLATNSLDGTGTTFSTGAKNLTVAGRKIVTRSGLVVDPVTLNVIRSLPGLEGTSFYPKTSKNGKYVILTEQFNRGLWVYKVGTWELIVHKPGNYGGCDINERGDTLIVGNYDSGGIEVYSFPDMELIQFLPHLARDNPSGFLNDDIFYLKYGQYLRFYSIAENNILFSKGIAGNPLRGISTDPKTGLPYFTTHTGSRYSETPLTRWPYDDYDVLTPPHGSLSGYYSAFNTEGNRLFVAFSSSSITAGLYGEVLPFTPEVSHTDVVFIGEPVPYIFSVDNDSYSKLSVMYAEDFSPMPTPMITDRIVSVSSSIITNEIVIQIESETSPFLVYSLPSFRRREISPEIPGDAHFEFSAGSGNKNSLSRDGSLYVAQLGGLKTYVYDTDDWSLKATIEDAGYFADFVYNSDDLSSPPAYLVFTKDVDFTSTDINVFDVEENDFVTSLYVNVPLRRDIFGPSLNKAENLLFSFRDNDNVAHAVRMFGSLHGTPIAFPSNFQSNQSFLNKEGNILYMNGTDETKAYDVSSGVTLLGTIEGVAFEDMVFGPDGSTAYAIVAEEE